MITKDEIKRKSENLYPEYLKSIVSGDIFFPKVLRSDKSVSKDFNEMRKELAEIIEFSKDKRGYGYTILYKQVSTRNHNTQSLPDEISFQTEIDYLKFLRKEAESNTFRVQVASTLSEFPELTDWIKKYPKKIIEHSQNWNSLLKVCAYFKQNPKPNLYARELPIQVDTKFVENNRGILLELLNIIMLPETVNTEFKTAKDFEKRFGLKFNQSQIRIRILDHEIARTYLSGLADISITEEEFNALKIPCERVFILENKTNYSNLMNFLTLPQLTGTIAIFGGGFMVGNLKKAVWLSTKQIFYWGDIDTHGLQILSQIRGYFPNTRSIMMDFETLNFFKDDWGKGEVTPVCNLTNLSLIEQELYNFLKADNINPIRLEQEKITHEYVLKWIKSIYGS